MGRTESVIVIAELKTKIKTCEKNKKQVLNHVENIKNKYLKKQITYSEYEKLIAKKLNGKTVQEWLDSYDSCIKKCEKKIKQQENKIAIKKIMIVSVSLAVILILIFLAFFLRPAIIGLIVQENLEFTDKINLQFTETNEYQWTPEHTGELQSVKVSGAVEGEGYVKVYLDDLLIFDSSNIEIKKASITGLSIDETEESYSEIGEQAPQEISPSQEEPVSSEQSEEPTLSSEQSEEPTLSSEHSEEPALSSEHSEEPTSSESNEPSVPSEPAEEQDSTQPADSEQEVTEEKPPVQPPIEQEPITEEENITEEELPENITQPTESVEIIIKEFKDLCEETCKINLNKSSYTLKIEINNATLKLDEIKYQLLTEEIPPENITIPEENLTPSIIENLTGNITNVTLKSERIIIGQPVKWTKKIKLKEPGAIKTTLPKQAENITVTKIKSADEKIKESYSEEAPQNISPSQEEPVSSEQSEEPVLSSEQSEEPVLSSEQSEPAVFSITGLVTEETEKNLGLSGFFRKILSLTGRAVTTEETTSEIEVTIDDNAREYEIEYYTEAPKATEETIGETKKLITISAPDELAYTDILAYTELPKEYPSGIINLYHLTEREKEKVAIDKYDLNENGLIDYIEWTVPHLSNETYELEITIINVQSYPMVGKNWTVMFNTTGIANLTITAANGTKWSNTNEDHDLKFLEIKCGSDILDYEWINDESVFIQDYECNEIGYETSKVLTEGIHTIEFDFGGIKAYAYNDAENLSIQINGSIGAYNSSVWLKTNSDSHSGYDAYDFDTSPPPEPYSEFYSNIQTNNLSVDSWNESTMPRILYLVYHITDAQTGTIEFKWDSLAGSVFSGTFVYYEDDSTYSSPVATRDMRTTSSYSDSISSETYLYVKVTIDKDREYPVFSNYWDNNASLVNSGTGNFNVTLKSTNGTVILEINNTNITATNVTANVYNASYNFDKPGVYAYRWHSWGNGTEENYNKSVERSYTVNTTDNEYPVFSNYWDNNASLVGSGTGFFNVTLKSTNGTVLLEINGVNVTATNVTANVYNASYNFISGGVYTYRWYSWGNGTGENFNISVTRSYTVNISDPIYPVFSNYWDNNATLISSGTGEFNVTVKDTNGTVILHINGTHILATNLTAYVYNVSFNFEKNGTYLYNWTAYGNGTKYNLNISANRDYTVNNSDTIYPIFSNYWDNNASLIDSGTGEFNVTVINTNGTVILEINNTNITATNMTANVYNASYDFSANGTYTYRWHSWGNGTDKLYNKSVERSYTVNTTEGLIGLTLTFPATETVNAPQNAFFNVTVNVSCYNANCGEINVSLDPEETVEDTEGNIITTQYEARINEPVKWKKSIHLEEPKGTLRVALPGQAANINIEKIVEREERAQITGMTIENKGNSILAFLRKLFSSITGRAITEEQEEILVIEDNATEYEIKYETISPKSSEKKISRTGKRITISAPDELNYTNVLAYTELSTEAPAETINLYHLTEKGKERVAIDKYDLNENGLIDYIEWTVPHLSEQTYELVIEIIAAEHLDKNKLFIKDIYQEVSQKDNIWTTINNKEYAKVTFSRELDNTKDITIYAKGNDSEIEVYTKNNQLIARFENVSQEAWYTVYLTELKVTEDVFYLKILGEVEFDYIVDPTIAPEQYIGGSAYSDVVAETGEMNFTHLNISATAPYNNLVLYYPFDGDKINSPDSNIVVYDWSNNNTNAIAYGNTTVITNGCVYGNCMNFSDRGGLDSKIKTGYVNDSSQEGTFSFWYYSYNASISSSYLGIVYPDFSLISNPFIREGVTGVSATYYNKSGDTLSIQSSCSIIDDKFKWVYLTFTHNETGGYIYKNGALCASDLTFTAGTYGTTYGNVGGAYGYLIFGYESLPQRHINATMDEFMYFNVSLTPSQISDLYKNQSSRFKTSGNQEMNDQSILNISSGNNRVNVTTDFEAKFGSSINLSVGYYDGSWSYTDPQTITAGTVHIFNVSSASTNLTLNYTFIAGNSSNPFYSPVLNGSVTYDVWYGGESNPIVKGLVNATEGAIPFYTNESNPRNISLNNGESQEIVFWVNATGTVGNNYTFFAYANKTSKMSIGNITSTWTVNITGEEIEDTEYPLFFDYWDDNASLSGSGTGNFNVSVKSTNGTVILEINNTNITASNISATVFNASYTFDKPGVYAYRWHSWGNGTDENYNKSVERSYTVNETDNPPNITIISPSNNSNFNISSVTFNISADKNVTWCGLSISGAVNETMTINSSNTGANYTNSSIADGFYNFIVSCNDTYNNFSYSSTYYFYIDTVFPLINFTDPTPSNDSTQSNTDILVNVTANDAASNISTFIDFDNSLVGWWRMDDINSSGDPYDYKGINNGSRKGGAAQTDAGKLGKGFEFDGNDDYISFPSAPADPFTATAGGTVSVWVKSKGADANNNKGIVNHIWGSSLQNRLYVLGYGDNTVMYQPMAWYDGTIECDDAIVPEDSNWYHIVLTSYENSSSVMHTKVYVNGVEKCYNISSVLNFSSGTTGREIGSMQSGTYQWNGTIDDVMIFNRSLSAEEIEALYANTSTRYLEHNFTELADGSHTFKAYTQDYGGNVNSTEEKEVTVDTTPPNNPVVLINSTDLSNKTLQDLHCFSTISDPESNSLNVSVEWYKEDAYQLRFDYNNSYTSGNLFNATLESENTTKGDNWSCGIRLYDGASYSDWVNSSKLEILNTAPEITKVYNNSLAITINEAPLPSEAVINFSVYDPDSADDINSTSSYANLSFPGEDLREKSGCTEIESSGDYANYSCNITMWWWDINDTWTITAYIEDNSSSSYINDTQMQDIGEQLAVQGGPSMILWTGSPPGSENRTSSNDPLLINNTGNIPITNLTINATNLRGEINNEKALWAGNFSVGISTGVLNPECSSIFMRHGLFTQIAIANISKGNYTSNVSAQEEFYFCITVVGSDLTTQAYSTAQEGPWTLSIIESFAVLIISRKKKRKLRKKAVLEEKEIPISIFSSPLGALEAVVKYMKENLQLTYKEISDLLYRDQRTVWTAYHKSREKMPEPIKVEGEMIKTSIFNNKMTILESVISSLKQKKLRNKEIAEILNRDERNIWTIYNNAIKKTKWKEEKSDKEKILIPISIFSKQLGGLEAVVKYMKENLHLRYKEISDLLERDQRTVWTAYHKSREKMPEPITVEKDILIPLSTFTKNLTALEAVISYLKQKQLRYIEIAGLLNRNQRNIWTIYSRALKKQKSVSLT